MLVIYDQIIIKKLFNNQKLIVFYSKLINQRIITIRKIFIFL